MPDKPLYAAEYRKEMAEHVRQTCLYVATKIGDLLDELVVVGGLVPSLLIPEGSVPRGEEMHVGTMDLDLGLSLALLDAARYEELTARLRRAGFEPDTNEVGNPTSQRWKIARWDRFAATVDFVIPPSRHEDEGGKIRHIEKDFAAVITPGLHLAFQDRQRVPLVGSTIMGEKARRDIWVCGPGAFLVLKALAFGSRGENKDAYDLYYVIRNHGSGVVDVLTHLKPIQHDRETRKALQILRRDFSDPDGVGPRRVAQFLYMAPSDELQADVAGFVRELLRECEMEEPGIAVDIQDVHS